MAAIVHCGINLEGEEEELVASEMVKRRVVDQVRVFSVRGTSLLTVTRAEGGVVTRRAPDEWIEQSRDHLRACDITYEEWNDLVADTHLLVPRLRVAHYGLKLPASAEVSRGRWGDVLHLQRLEDVRRRLDLGTRLRMRSLERLSPEERAMLAIIELLSNCERLGIVAGISP